MVQIGAQKIGTNIFLAPLAGVADYSYRLIAREHGAGLAFFEMLDCNAVLHGANKNFDILRNDGKDQPIAAQLVGAEPLKMAKAAKALLKLINPVFLDINAACPVRKVVQKKAGAYLVQEPDQLGKIIRAVAGAISIPVTVKLRVGFNEIDFDRVAELARVCEASGAAALFVHGRTRQQLYSGEVNYQAIKTVKDSVHIPVFGSGNVFSPQLAKQMLAQTGCDGLLVARGSLGNPWIFTSISHYLETGEMLPAVSQQEKSLVCLQHLDLINEYKNARPNGKLGFMRKIAMWYLKGFPEAAGLRNQISQVKSFDQLRCLVSSLSLS